MHMRRFVVLGGLLVAVFGLVAAQTYAQSPRESIGEQWKVAMEHAKLAQDAKTQKDVQLHIQHVINCLEGRGGGMFDASQGNPCQGKGQGMMVDAKSHKHAYWVELSAKVAAMGMKAKSADEARAAAWITEQALKQTGAVLR